MITKDIIKNIFLADKFMIYENLKIKIWQIIVQFLFKKTESESWIFAAFEKFPVFLKKIPNKSKAIIYFQN